MSPIPLGIWAIAGAGSSATGWIGVFSAYIYTCVGMAFTGSTMWVGYSNVQNGVSGKYFSVNPTTGALLGAKYTTANGTPVVTGSPASLSLNAAGTNIFYSTWVYAEGSVLTKVLASTNGIVASVPNVFSYTTNGQIALDSSDNVYLTESGYYSSQGRLQIRKYNSSLALQWSRQLTNGNREYAGGISVDASSNVYSAGLFNFTTTPVSSLVKYNSSGTIQWQRSFSITQTASYPGAGNATNGQYLASDSSSNQYVIALTTNQATASLNYGYITKVDSSGTTQWSRRLSSSNGVIPTAVSVSTTGDVYVTAIERTAGSDGSYLIKYNSSGTLQWQSYITRSTGYVRIHMNKVNGSSVFLGGETTDRSILINYPTTGNLFGTFTAGTETFTIAAGTLTDTASGGSYSASSLTDSSGGSTSGSHVTVNSTTSETITTKVIP
jgi:hypothetical protein